MTQEDCLTIEGVQFTDSRIAHYEGGEPIRPFIPKSTVRIIQVKYGFQANRPITQACIGFALLPTSTIFLVNYVMSCIYTSTLPSKFIPLGMLFLVFGSLWILRDALKRGLYLEVKTTDNTHKFALSKQTTPECLSNFVEEARIRFGYSINCANHVLVPPRG